MPPLFALTLSDIIRAKKSDVKIGDWESGAIPKAKFPINRKKLSLGRGWKWRVVTFRAVQQNFVVFVALSAEKESYRATLAMNDVQNAQSHFFS